PLAVAGRRHLGPRGGSFQSSGTRWRTDVPLGPRPSVRPRGGPRRRGPPPPAPPHRRLSLPGRAVLRSARRPPPPPAPTPAPSLEVLCPRMHELKDLGGVLGPLTWDQETYLPSKAGPARAAQLATLQGLYHQRLVAPEVGDWLEQAERGDIDAETRAMLKV